VRRALILVLLALLTFDVTGLAALCGDPGCDEDCPTDLSGGDCAPNCHSCSCCSLPKVAGSTTPAAIALTSTGISWFAASRGLPSPEPADILHVPKLLLA
jgi:hypothetical protein